MFSPTAWTSIRLPRALTVSTLTGSVQCGPSRIVPSESWLRMLSVLISMPQILARGRSCGSVRCFHGNPPQAGAIFGLPEPEQGDAHGRQPKELAIHAPHHKDLRTAWESPTTAEPDSLAVVRR